MHLVDENIYRTFFGILTSRNIHPFPRSTQPFIPLKLNTNREIAILALVVRSLSYRSSSTRAAFLRASSDENRLFLAFRLRIRILNLLNRYHETTTSVTTECKMWISQVSNTNPPLSRLLHTAIDKQHRQSRLPMP